MRIAVCGGRKFKDWKLLKNTLDHLSKSRYISSVIHGGQTGADRMGGHWAKQRGIPEEVYYADWRQGRSAGPRRNAQMVEIAKPELVVEFPGGKGTADMVRRSKEAGIDVVTAIDLMKQIEADADVYRIHQD